MSKGKCLKHTCLPLNNTLRRDFLLTRRTIHIPPHPHIYSSRIKQVVAICDRNTLALLQRIQSDWTTIILCDRPTFHQLCRKLGNRAYRNLRHSWIHNDIQHLEPQRLLLNPMRHIRLARLILIRIEKVPWITVQNIEVNDRHPRLQAPIVGRVGGSPNIDVSLTVFLICLHTRWCIPCKVLLPYLDTTEPKLVIMRGSLTAM